MPPVRIIYSRKRKNYFTFLPCSAAVSTNGRFFWTSIASIYKIPYYTAFLSESGRQGKRSDFVNLPLQTLIKYYRRLMKYTKYSTFNCQGLNNDNKKSSLADDFLHHQITIMMLQETRITGQGVHKITSSNGTELFLYNSGHRSTSYDITGFLVATKAEVTFKPISERISILTTTMKKRKYCFISVYTPTNESTVKDLQITRTFNEQLSDIISNINRNHLDFQSKRKLKRNRPFLAWGREPRNWEL